MDLKVKIAGVTFKNPILPAASELVFDGYTAKKMIKQGVGGIVTKTFTTSPEFRIRIRPYQFPLTNFDIAFKKSGSFYSQASPHVEDINTVMERNIPEIAQVCKENNVPLIVSFYEKPNDLASWRKVSKGIEEAGAQMLEINLSSPTMKGELEKDFRTSFKIVESIAKSTTIPFGIKISPMFEPLTNAIIGWKERGVSFITAHNAPNGIYIDVDEETAYGAPSIGGYLIGRPFLPISLARVVQVLKTIDIPVIGVGGIFTGKDALQYILCGATLVQIASAAYMEGLGVFKKVLKEIIIWMRRKRYYSISEYRGKVLQKIVSAKELRLKEKHPYDLPPHVPYIPKISRNKCTFCNLCSRTCLYGVLKVAKGSIVINEEQCWGCGFCVGICPRGAISLINKQTRKPVWKGRGIALPFR